MSGRGAKSAWVALVALAGCGWCGTPQPVVAPASPPAPARAEAVAPVAVNLSAVQGEVAIGHEGRGWSPAVVGATLGLDDTVRTAPGGAATLRVGRDGSVEVRERTEVAVRQLLPDAVRFRLQRGRIGATPGHVAMAVESEGSSAVAEATTGAFAVFNDGKGLVAVVAEAGEVKLTTAGGDAMLAAGEGARVLGNAAPRREAVPRSVLLKVAWPEEKATRQAALTVRGEADPGAEVSVNGRPAVVGLDGRFELEVPLAPGVNRFAVRSTDRFGRIADDSAQFLVDRRPPPLKAQSEGWQ
jgi:hypothetical protein